MGIVAAPCARWQFMRGPVRNGGRGRLLNWVVRGHEMRFSAFTRGEKRLLIAAFVAACLAGSLAALVAYEDEEEAQFHGGVLEEDAAEAKLALFCEPISAFARWGIGSVLIFGVAPIVVWRLLPRRKQ